MAYYILLHYPACPSATYHSSSSHPQSNENLEHPQSVIFKSRPAAAEASKWWQLQCVVIWLVVDIVVVVLPGGGCGGGLYVSLSCVSHFAGEGIKRALAMM